ncbi:LysE family translocator [Oricola thermophila]|uniref:LysE family translocator n=1 Tax=Oricola thermophila TaxID=2742145 RepID=A0A6N1VC83_9HYPH|nr:LysE family translocator [Oricola thermophila]QKV18278.1 LysE family translocator [Oricola thermophila]
MEISALVPLAIYIFVMTITPGPNNMMLASSGLVFGIGRSVPHILGITSGVALQLLLTGFGLGTIFAAEPAIQFALKVLGTAYLFWLSSRLWQAGAPESVSSPRPINFREAAVFQFINPKAWLIAVTICSVFLSSQYSMLLQITVFSLAFLAVGAPSMLAWVCFGASVRRLTTNSHRIRLINRIMAGLTAFTGAMFWM